MLRARLRLTNKLFNMRRRRRTATQDKCVWETGAGTHRLQPITVSSWKLAQVNLQLWVDASIPCKCNWRFEVNAPAHGGASGFIKLDFA